MDLLSGIQSRERSTSVPDVEIPEKPDLSKLPKWILLKLRDEMVARQDMENKVLETKNEMARIKQEAESWQREAVEKFEEQLKKAKAQNYEYLLQVSEWKKEKEREYEEELAERDAIIEKNRQQIASAIQEIKLWKEAQDTSFQEITQAKDKEIQEKEIEIQSLKEKLRTLEKLGKTTPKSNSDSNFENPKERRNTVALANFNNLTKMHSEVSAKRLSEEVRSKAELVQLEIADLIIRKQKEEYIVSEAERAKIELPNLEKQLHQKRKDLLDLMKDVKKEKILKNKQKQKLEEIENKLSIVPDVVRRKQLIKKAQKLPVITPFETASVLVQYVGPSEDEGLKNFKDVLSCQSVSLYPIDTKSNTRMGDPIADRYNAIQFSDGTLFALCDGAGWGEASRAAALKASNTFIGYMKDFRNQVANTNQAVRLMFRALSVSHKSIIEGKNIQTMYEAGTTTIIGGLTFKLPDQKNKVALVFVSLGDCKLFAYSSTTQTVVDLTSGNRVDIRDLRDPGGRLGPMKGDQGDPDLKNLNSGCHVCNVGDIVIAVSDGIHDNLDPVNTGKTPKDLGIETASNYWHEVPNEEEIRIKYQMNQLEKFIKKSPKAPDVVSNLLDHAKKITHESRSFMEREGRPQPNDLTKYPGKMDHATVLCFQIK